MELRNAGFIHAQFVGNLLHVEFVPIVQVEDFTLTLTQAGKRPT